MFSIRDAEKITEGRAITIDDSDGWSVNLTGKYRLHELEAICALIRHHANNTVMGVEDRMRTDGLQNIMPYARLEAIVRQYFQKLVTAVTTTMRDDVAQLRNPGSVPVYGEATDDKNPGLKFTKDVMTSMTDEELTIIINEMTTSLAAQGCSRSTQQVAVGMLMNMVLPEEQEVLISRIERRQKPT